MSLRLGMLLVAAVALCAQDAAVNQTTASRELAVTVGKSVLVDSPQQIERISIANGELAEAVAITPREILVNGKAAGETSMIVWQQGGNRLFFDLTVRRSEARVDGIRRELAQELGNQDVNLEMEGDAVFLRGTVADLTSANRAIEIASTLGRPVNLLRVNIPGTDAQILLKVKFADVDRSATQQLGVNIFSTGATGSIGRVSTGQFSPPTITPDIQGGTTNTTLSLTNALQVFLFRPDLNLGATIAALQSKNMLQILAEPNVLAINGRNASFLAGGEFPFPNLQGGGAGLGAVTIQFREFGVRINFTPTITPRGTIRLNVTPEVSSLDFANGLIFNGFTIPALTTRRVSTEIELEEGQTFAIGGLLDNRDTETFNKVPALGDIPFFGKLFRSRQITKNNSELLVMVTPELVRPIPKGQATPELKFPGTFLEPNTSSEAPRTPGMDKTGPVPTTAPRASMPIEELLKSMQPNAQPQGNAPMLQFVPMMAPAPAAAAPAAQPQAQPQAQPAAPAQR
ncbi:MAG: pilus assembly protein N-terminal domain-containing protein [Bryobacteraceae bacterium]